MSKKFGEGVNPMNRKWSRSKTILTCAFLVLAMLLCDAQSSERPADGQSDGDSDVRAQVWPAVFGVSYGVAGAE